MWTSLRRAAPCRCVPVNSDVRQHGKRVATTRKKSMRPDDFRVNATWLAFRFNQKPLQSEEGEHDVFVLQDAGSMFIFGTAFAPHESAAPSHVEVERLLQSAWAHREEWPEELVLPGKPSSDNAFVRAAAAVGIPVRSVPEAAMSFYIRDVQSAFEEYFARDAGDA